MTKARHYVAIAKEKPSKFSDDYIGQFSTAPTSQSAPNKYLLVFFMLLSVVILSYLVFSSVEVTTAKPYPLTNEQPNNDDTSTSYFESLIGTMNSIRKRFLHIGDISFESPRKEPPKKGYTKKMKRILIYTKLFGSVEWHHMPRSKLGSIMSKCKCKIDQCRVTYNKRLIKRSDAVVFHAADMPHPDNLRTLRQRPGSSRQRWVYFTSESPQNVPDTGPLQDFFNLTMTVKIESDIWNPYGRFVPLDANDKRPSLKENYAKDKDPGAAWVVSHCGTLRDQFVIRLQEEYPVHVGGSCGPLFKYQMLCDKGCDQEIKEKYKFYLAFENGFCRNYITEKYWDRAIDNNVIPVVMGGGPYDYGQYGAIPGSYIKVEEFSSVLDLAAYLTYLDKNDTAYNEFFLWKQKYKRFKPRGGGWPYPCVFLCQLCDIVHNLDYPEKSYDLSKFLDVHKNCAGREKLVQGILSHSRDLYDQM